MVASIEGTNGAVPLPTSEAEDGDGKRGRGDRERGQAQRRAQPAAGTRRLAREARCRGQHEARRAPGGEERGLVAHQRRERDDGEERPAPPQREAARLQAGQQHECLNRERRVQRMLHPDHGQPRQEPQHDRQDRDEQVTRPPAPRGQQIILVAGEQPDDPEPRGDVERDGEDLQQAGVPERQPGQEHRPPRR
jgi:hypothetical protein